MLGVDDTARIAYAAMIDNTAQVFSVEPDGGRSIQLTLDLKYKCRPVWSLDHKQIAFFRYVSDRPVGGFLDLVVMNANGSGVREVVKHLKVDVQKTRPSWNMEGTVLYVQEQDFPTVLFGYAVADGRQVETIRLPQGTYLNQAHTLSPDSRFIAGAGPERKTGLQHIGIVPRAGGPDMDLMRPFSKMALHVGNVVWSYDSQLVAFELDNVVLVTSSAAGPGFRAYPLTPQETAAELSGPAFSPSGKSIACILEKTREDVMGGGDKEVRSDIWIMSVDGKQPRQLTHSGSCFDPHW